MWPRCRLVLAAVRKTPMQHVKHGLLAVAYAVKPIRFHFIVGKRACMCVRVRVRACMCVCVRVIISGFSIRSPIICTWLGKP